MQITMGLMANSVKQQKIVGLDPRENLFTPVDLIPIAGGAIKARRGYLAFRAAVPVMEREALTIGYRIGLPSAVRRHNLVRRQVIEGGRDILKGMGIVLTGIIARREYTRLYENAASADKKSRGRGPSLTSELMTPRQPQTKRSNASAGKRTFPPRLSKGGNVNGRARRQTSYCNLHKKYDFCEYYKK